MKKLFASVAIAFAAAGSILAQDYIVVGKAGNIYDEANAKYITVNQNNEDLSVIPGMVFAMAQHVPGWYKVEYSPGLHAFIPDQIAASTFVAVAPGTYDIKNNPGQKITLAGSGDAWTATVDGKTYKGVKQGEIIIFTDGSKNPAFTIVDIGSGPIAINYNNAVTKFF